MRITSEGKVGINTTDPTQKLEVLGSVFANNGDIIQSSNLSSNGSFFNLIRKSRGTFDSPTAVLNSDTLGGIQGGGYDGTSYVYNAGIYFRVSSTDTISTGNVPIDIDFRTLGSSQANTRLRIRADGSAEFTGDVNMTENLSVTKNATLGELNVSGLSTFTGAVDMNGDLDVDGTTNLDILT